MARSAANKLCILPKWIVTYANYSAGRRSLFGAQRLEDYNALRLMEFLDNLMKQGTSEEKIRDELEKLLTEVLTALQRDGFAVSPDGFGPLETLEGFILAVQREKSDAAHRRGEPTTSDEEESFAAAEVDDDSGDDFNVDWTIAMPSHVLPKVLERRARIAAAAAAAPPSDSESGGKCDRKSSRVNKKKWKNENKKNDKSNVFVGDADVEMSPL